MLNVYSLRVVWVSRRVAAVVAFLASNAALYVTEIETGLTLNGGMYMVKPRRRA